MFYLKAVFKVGSPQSSVGKVFFIVPSFADRGLPIADLVVKIMTLWTNT
jgi:hypothetical protein